MPYNIGLRKSDTKDSSTMTNDMQNSNYSDQKSGKYGTYLQSRRESMGLDRKDAAAQLRLSERVIEILETENYPADLPVTFLRGYIRSYSKLLQIPDHELQAALEPIQPPKPVQMDKPLAAMNDTIKMDGTNYYMQFSTYAIIATVATLVGMWWYNHTPAANANQIETHALALEGQTATGTTPSSPTDVAKPAANSAAMMAPANNLTPQVAAPTTNDMANKAKAPMQASAQNQQPAVGAATAPPATNKPADRPSYASNHHERYDDEDYDDEHSPSGSSD